MASLSEQKLKEMEEEMNRFEQEILVTQDSEDYPGASRMIIGARTFDKVRAQLAAKSSPDDEADDDPGTSLPAPSRSKPTEVAPVVAPPLLPPPPPPPPIRTGFIPHQVRHRQPLQPPPRPPFFMRPRPPMGQNMRPPQFPPRPPMMVGPNQGPRPFMPNQGQTPYYAVSDGTRPEHQAADAGNNNQSMGNNTVEKSKVIYSAPPAINIPKKKSKPKSAKKRTHKTESTDDSPVVAAKVPDLAPDIPPPASMDMMEGEDMTVADMDIDLGEMRNADFDPNGRKDRRDRKKKFVRTAAGETWEDPTLAEWDPDDFRIFCGDLGNEVTDEILARAFSKFSSFKKAKVIRDKRSQKTKGYGFVSFRDPEDFVRAMREMNGKYVGNRPIKLRKSAWKERNTDNVRKKEREKKRLGFR